MCLPYIVDKSKEAENWKCFTPENTGFQCGNFTKVLVSLKPLQSEYDYKLTKYIVFV